ncbi:MAG: tyrosine-type recombinase/integrase [Dehalogenimonas sp.]
MSNSLIQTNVQSYPVSAINLLISQNGLKGDYFSFLLACKVNGLSAATIRYYRQTVGGLVEFLISQGIDDPAKVIPFHIRAYLLDRQTKVSAISVNDAYRGIRRFFNWLVEEKVVSETPMTNIRPPKVPQKVIQPFTAEDIGRLLSAIDGRVFTSMRNRAIILMFADTGLRLSELVGIKLEDINLGAETVKVLGKGARERFVRIGRQAQRALINYLKQRQGDSPWLWLGYDGYPLQKSGVRLMLSILGKKAGLEHVRCSPHTFRHFFAVTALLNGAGEFDVQSLLGHSDLTMTRHYAASLSSANAVKNHRRFSPIDNLKVKV